MRFYKIRLIYRVRPDVFDAQKCCDGDPTVSSNMVFRSVKTISAGFHQDARNITDGFPDLTSEDIFNKWLWELMSSRIGILFVE